MAAFDHVRDINDVALRPRLLRSLVNEHLPDETLPLRDSSELSFIVSTLKTHKLLSEEIPPSADDKLVSAWNSAVDAWVDRILLLARSNLPDKCWAGVCLLGVTCTECSSARFLASYSDWFNVLLSHIQPSVGSQFVKVASCAAVSDLFTRLGGFSNLKKDGNSHAGKLLPPILKMFDEDVAEAVLEVAVHLLLTILNTFPASVHRHHENLESVIVSKIMSADCSANLLKKLSCCLASLPKSKGDEDSWSLMMQRILLSLCALLNCAFEGLEDETRRAEVVALLVPPGEDPPASLGGKSMTGVASSAGERSLKSLISSISSLMQCCSIMLSHSYPFQVEVPVRPILAIINRVLMVNGSLPETLQPFTTAMQQELVCLHLPVLHLNVLDVLVAAVKGLRSQLLPHAAEVNWLLMKYFKTCWLPELRIKVYTIIKNLLISMGSGMALYIMDEVIDNGSVDLKFSDCKYDGAPLKEQLCVEVSLQHRRKKRKQGATSGPSVEQQTVLCSEPKECQASISLKIAAIETLEALLVVGGALRNDNWRRRIDDLMMEVATNACREGWPHDEKPFHGKGPTVVAWEDFQLVALRALLASLLSPAGYRPPYLSKSLELLRKGKQNGGTKVAEFCAQALLALEVFVHPRALPLLEMPLPNGASDSIGKIDFGGPKNKFPHTDGIRTGQGNSHDVYDFLNDMYMEDNPGSVVPEGDFCKDVQSDHKMRDISMDGNDVEPDVVNGSTDNVMPLESDACLGSANIVDNIGSNDRRGAPDVQHGEEPYRAAPVDNIKLPSSPLSAKKGFEKNVSDATAYSVSGASVSGDVLAARGIASTTEVDDAVTASSGNRFNASPMEQDDESSDSFPDIVDADPDPETDQDSG